LKPVATIGATRPTIEKEMRERKRATIFYVVVAVFVLLMVLNYIWTSVQMVETRWRLKLAMNENKLLASEQEKLVVERAALLIPSRIESEAKERLHMELPNRVEFVSLVELGTSEVSSEGTFETFFRSIGREESSGVSRKVAAE
jgi:cell division protein FtsL